MSDYKELDVWKLSVQLSIDIYKLIRTFPKSEQFGLSDQIKRAAVSIPSNIAEGAGRASKKDFAHFLSIANGSACELETQLLIAFNVGFLSQNDLTKNIDLIIRIRKMLTKLRQSLLK